MALENNTAKALQVKVKSGAETSASKYHLAKLPVHGNAAHASNGRHRGFDDVNSHGLNGLTKDNPSLEYVVPIRTRSQTLSMKGRESILNRFRKRRLTQRQSFIDQILEGLDQDEVEAVHEENRLKKAFGRSEIDTSREIWKRHAEWLTTEPEPLLAPHSAERAWNDTSRDETTRIVGLEWTESNPEAITAVNESESWRPTQSWGSDGTAWSPRSRAEWRGSDEETEAEGDIGGHKHEIQDKEPQSDAEALTWRIDEEDAEELDEHAGQEKDRQSQDEEEGEGDKDLFTVTFEFPGWYAVQGQDRPSTLLEMQSTSDVTELSHKISHTTEADENVGCEELGYPLTPSCQQHETTAPPSSGPSTESMAVRLLRHRPSCKIYGSVDKDLDDQLDHIDGPNRCGTVRHQDIVDFLHYPGPPPLLMLPDFEMRDKGKSLPGTGEKETDQYGRATAHNEASIEEASRVTLLPEETSQLPTPPSSPSVPASPAPTNKPALLLKKLAEEIFPLVLDKDGYMFESLLKDGVKILESRASNRWGLKNRPKPTHSGLREALTVDDKRWDNVEKT